MQSMVLSLVLETLVPKLTARIAFFSVSGHGTTHYANSVYAALDDMLKELGYSHTFLYTFFFVQQSLEWDAHMVYVDGALFAIYDFHKSADCSAAFYGKLFINAQNKTDISWMA